MMTIKDLYTFCYENDVEINLRIYKFAKNYDCIIRMTKGPIKYETRITPLAMVNSSDDSVLAQICDLFKHVKEDLDHDQN